MSLSERQNPFDPIYELCDIGNSRQKLENLSEFPRIIDVELTNTCNYRCICCPTGAGTVTRRKGIMKDEVFYRILDEAKEHKTPIRFTVFGEPLLHPKLIDFIKATKSAGLICHINTNGNLLTDQLISDFVEIPLDSIKFSMQGVDRDTYREMRNIDFFDELIDRIKCLYQVRGDGLLPYIHINTSITYETDEQCDQFKEATSTFCDKFSIGRTNFEYVDVEQAKLNEEEKDRIRNLIPKQTISKIYYDCKEVFEKITVYWDGRVTACCADYDNLMSLGDIFQNSIKELWSSDKANYYREMLVNRRHSELPLCKICYGKLHQHTSDND